MCALLENMRTLKKDRLEPALNRLEQEHVTYVIRKGETSVGFCVVIYHHEQKFVDLNHFFICETERKKGICTTFMDRVLKPKARELNYPIKLDTDDAQVIWERMGFVFRGVSQTGKELGQWIPDRVEVKKTAVSGGRGLFATREINPGDIVFEERVVEVCDIMNLCGKRWDGVSKSWPLAALLLMLGEKRPDWIDGLYGDTKLSEKLLAENEDDNEDANLYKAMSEKRPPDQVRVMFSKAVTNFFANDGIVWLGHLSSMMNHSIIPNVGMTSPVPQQHVVQYVASKKIEAGEELVITYPKEYAALLL